MPFRIYSLFRLKAGEEARLNVEVKGFRIADTPAKVKCFQLFSLFQIHFPSFLLNKNVKLTVE